MTPLIAAVKQWELEKQIPVYRETLKQQPPTTVAPRLPISTLDDWLVARGLIKQRRADD